MAVKNKLMPFIVGILLILTYFVSVLNYSARRTLLIVMALLLLFSPFLGNKKIRIRSVDCIWIFSLLIVVTSMMRFQIDQFYLLFYFSIIGFLLLSDSNTDWMSAVLNVAILMGGIYAAFTIIQVIASDFYMSRLYPLLQYNSTFDVARYMRFGIYSGLTYQTAVNALYLSIGIGATFCSLLYDKTARVWKVILIAVELICIMLSAKRGHLLFVVLSLLIITYYSGNKGKRIRNIMIIGILLFVLYIIAYYKVPSVSYFFDRLSNTDGDITNGRITLYVSAVEHFKTHPIFGIGWEQFRNVYIRYIDVHNIYLQLLCETGLVGTAVFLTAFIGTLVYTIKKINAIVSSRTIYREKYLLLFGLFCQVFFLLYGFTGNALYDYYVLSFYFIGAVISLKSPLKGDVK